MTETKVPCVNRVVFSFGESNEFGFDSAVGCGVLNEEVKGGFVRWKAPRCEPTPMTDTITSSSPHQTSREQRPSSPIGYPEDACGNTAGVISTSGVQPSHEK
ncbi:hypothetical protein BC936DRAFT_148621 [Jimgerdemannia flammicorona]|uniref:Uncharacterized protein n=1 Tax=Jimgerdemannia flammicorona TaxID=994334 RepID=A0A433D2L0_9FUNG|nr:hypothetical protein BC936DRAFT_148621 [Jimgerdemannia flammicorona]